MLRYDFHIHTEYCGHAPGMKVADIAAAADKLNLDAICIADHIQKDSILGAVSRF